MTDLNESVRAFADAYIAAMPADILQETFDNLPISPRQALTESPPVIEGVQAALKINGVALGPHTCRYTGLAGLGQAVVVKLCLMCGAIDVAALNRAVADLIDRANQPAGLLATRLREHADKWEHRANTFTAKAQPEASLAEEDTTSIPAVVDDLPGMWEKSDLMGGAIDASFLNPDGKVRPEYMNDMVRAERYHGE